MYQLYEGRELKEDKKLKEEFGLDSLRINILKVAIPNRWKAFFKENDVITILPLPPHNYDSDCVLRAKLSSKVYKYLISDEFLLYKKFIKWENDCQLCTNYDDFLKEFNQIYKITNVTKFRSFQYRLLQTRTCAEYASF